MSNILQVTDPSTYTDNRNIHTGQEARNPLAGPQIKNPSDPSRVVRADDQKSGNTDTATTDKGFGIKNYNGNYAAFLQKLGEESEVTDVLGRILSQEGAAGVRGDEGLGSIVQKLLSSAQFEEPDQLLDFLKEQGQTKFSGDFFEGLRNLLLESRSSGLQNTALQFLRVFNNYSSGEHLLEQMHSLMDQLKGMMYTSVRKEYEPLVEAMNWEAPNGEVEENTAVLFKQIIPFLSKYISRTHDYGEVRDTVIQLLLYGARYENGGSSQLKRLYSQMAASREFKQFFSMDPEELFEHLTGNSDREGGTYAELFGSLVERGADGEAGLEQVQDFYQLMRGMLINESVYMPLNHFIVPFQYQGKEAVSEFWVNPDAEKNGEEEAGGRKVRLMVNFDIQNLGSFQMIADLQDHKVSVELGVPRPLASQTGDIQKKVSEICARNGMTVKHMQVQERTSAYLLTDVFPEIRRKENGINVSI